MKSHPWLLCASSILALVILCTCERRERRPLQTDVGRLKMARLSDSGLATTIPRFQRLSSEATGIDFVHRFDPPEGFEADLANAFAGGGVCVGDYDGDGKADVYVGRLSRRVEWKSDSTE